MFDLVLSIDRVIVSCRLSNAESGLLEVVTELYVVLYVFVFVCVYRVIDVLVSQLMLLSSSPILAVRRLSSQALAKLIPQCNRSSFITDIILSFPSSNDAATIHYNWLHGQLLQVHYVLKYLLATNGKR